MLVPTVKYQILDIWMSNIRALMCGTQHSIFGTQYSGFDIYTVRFPNHFTLQSCYTMNFNTSQWNSGLDRRDSIFDIGVSIVRPRYSGLDRRDLIFDIRVSIVGSRYSALDSRVLIVGSRYSIFGTG